MDDLTGLLSRCEYYDKSHRELTRRTLVWVLSKGLYRRTDQAESSMECLRRSFIAASFAYFVAPAASEIVVEGPEDPLRGRFLASLVLIILFILDDLAGAEERRAMAAVLAERPGCSPGVGACDRNADALRSFLLELQCLGEATDWFVDCLLEMIEVFAREQERDPATVSEAEFQKLRDVTIGIPVYTALLELVCHIRISSEMRPGLLLYRRMTSTLCYMVDDFVSLKRDLREGGSHPEDLADINLILVRRRERGCSLADAKRTVVLDYNDLTYAFEREGDRLRAVGDAAIDRYVRLLARVVNGNIAAHGFLLGARYSVEPEVFLLRQVGEEGWPFRTT